MTIQTPFISVAICTYNRERYLPQLFDSILRQTLNRNRFEVLLVNNNSPGNTEDIGRVFSQEHQDIHYRYFLETNQGLSFARNRCIREAKGDFITFLDDDAFIQEDYLECLLKHFIENDDISAMGGKILLHYEDIIPAWGNRYLNQLLGFYNEGDAVFTYSKQKKSYPMGSNMSFRCSVFKEVGLFSTELGRVGNSLRGGEEKDMFYRIFSLDHYKVVYFPDLVVYHCVPEERTTDAFVKRQAIETGGSERIRVRNLGTFGASVKMYLREMFKWVASLALFLAYTLKFQYSKASMIVKFRYWVSKGMLNKNIL